MKIRNASHRGLRRFIELDDPSGLDPAILERVRNMLTFLDEMSNPREMLALPHWRAHVLTGNRKGTWSLSVNRNWRLTFKINEANEIVGLNLEDYH
jgi:proteic killer suppression protein